MWWCSSSSSTSAMMEDLQFSKICVRLEASLVLTGRHRRKTNSAPGSQLGLNAPNRNRQFCSPSPPTSSPEPRAAQQLMERTKRNPESFIVAGRTATNCREGLVRAARWGASEAAARSATKRRPGRVSAPVQQQDFQELLVLKAQPKCGNNRARPVVR